MLFGGDFLNFSLWFGFCLGLCLFGLSDFLGQVFSFLYKLSCGGYGFVFRRGCCTVGDVFLSVAGMNWQPIQQKM